MKNNSLKTIFTGVIGILSAKFGALFVPFVLLLISNLIDYWTGIKAVPYRKNDGISSYKSMKGITKKVCMWLLVVVGGMIDILLKYSAETIGFTVPFNFLVASIVAIWIVCNEIISILENMVDIGINLPNFLMPLVKNLKTYTEKITTLEETREEE